MLEGEYARTMDNGNSYEFVEYEKLFKQQCFGDII